MHSSVQKLTLVKSKINEIIKQKQLKSNPTIIVISKTFSLEKIKPLLDNGHIHFGENKIQEAESKWTEIINNNKNLQLHMVGRLQSNKAKKAVKLFNFIHSLDSEKLALKLSQSEKELNKKIKLFVQVNLGEESQKTGVDFKDLHNFYNYCSNDLQLNIVGLMCLPPVNLNSDKFFKILKSSAEKLNLKELSIGMSSDFEKAIINGSTYLRLGTAILGDRNVK
tara:strand:- start:557 stop:1225 length:669 start_codon:yes stop_codon:yes gene_type:complete